MTSEPIKLVFAGPMGAGKTTAIRSIADSEPISTEMDLTEGATSEKSTTTVAFDFALVMLDDGTPLHVYGMPGQEYFGFMRKILLNGAIGVVLILDGSAADVGADCANWLASLKESDAPTQIVIGITKTDRAPQFSLTAVRAAIRNSHQLIPVFTVDVREPEQTIHLVRALLLSIMT